MNKGPRGSRIAIVANKEGMILAEKVAGILETEVEPAIVRRHDDGEIEPDLTRSIKGADVFYIAPFHPDPAIRLTEANLIGDAVDKSFPARRILVPTYLGFERSDWKAHARSSISIREVAVEVEQHWQYCVTFHTHSPQIEGMFRIPFDSFMPYEQIALYLDKLDVDPERTVVVSPDVGGAAFARKVYEYCKLAAPGIVYKLRERPGTSEAIGIMGNVQDMDVLLVDDLISGGGTMKNAAALCKERGARNVYAYGTHGLFSPKIIRPTDNRDAEKELLKDIPESDTRRIETFRLGQEDLREDLQRALFYEGVFDSRSYRVVASDTGDQRAYVRIPAEETLRNSFLDGTAVTNTIPRTDHYYEKNPWLAPLYIDERVAEIIGAIHENESLERFHKH